MLSQFFILQLNSFSKLVFVQCCC